MSEFVVCGAPFETLDPVTGVATPLSAEALASALAELKSTGVTSVQIYTYWNRFEPTARGEFDWSYYDQQVAALKQAGLRWVPFFLMGPRYAAPDWWLADPGHRELFCLEHGKPDPCESVWNEAFLAEVDRVLAAFAAHYLPMNVMESFQPGISGDYGETEFPDIGNWPGCYHAHRGFWCGGADALASYRHWLRERFGSVEAANAAWGTKWASLDEARPFLPHEAPSRTAWYGFLDWYRGSMTEYTGAWLSLCRKHLPDTPIYLCVGGMEQPELATQFAEQVKLCAKYGCGIRLTNEGNKFYDNYHWTALAKSACDQYGAYMGLEPVGPITPNGVATRVFGSAAYGNRQMFNYYTNLMGDDHRPNAGGAAFQRYHRLVSQRQPEPGIAMFWPGDFSSFFASHPENLNDNTSTGIPKAVSGALSFLRRQVHTVPVNERLILDGGLSRFTVLVSPLCVFTRGETLRAIADWIKQGGVFVSAGVPKDLELRDVPELLEAMGLRPDYETTVGHHTQHITAQCPYPRLADFGSYHSAGSVMGWTEDSVPISISHPSRWGATVTAATVGALEHEYGNGRSILWMGHVAFEEDPDAIFPDSGWFRELLRDVIDRYAQLPSLAPEDGEIARAVIDGHMMALTDQYEIIEV